MGRLGPLLAMVILVPATAAVAAPVSCQQERDALRGGLQLGSGPNFDAGAQLLGVVETHPKLCVPTGIQLGTLEAVFEHWADTHPNAIRGDAWVCAELAFRDSFPCKQ